MPNITDVKSDRMRYTKNKISANLAYVAIVFNALYFISIYSSDVGNYYYSLQIGISVVYNLLFMLFTFLGSEGVKSYDYKFSGLLIGLGAMQIVRIFVIPLDAYSTFVKVGTKTLQVMTQDQFILCVVYLSISALCAIAGGIIGILKTKKLRDYEKNLVQD